MKISYTFSIDIYYNTPCYIMSIIIILYIGTAGSLLSH